MWELDVPFVHNSKLQFVPFAFSIIDAMHKIGLWRLVVPVYM